MGTYFRIIRLWFQEIIVSTYYVKIIIMHNNFENKY